MNKFNDGEFFAWLEETFVTNRFSRDIIVNLIGYGLQEKNNAKDQFISFIADIIPDVSMYDVAMFCSHDMLTGDTLETIRNRSL